MPLTNQEKNRLDAIMALADAPNTGGGEGFSVKVLYYMFMKIVDLRDFALDQLDVNQQLRQRLRRLEEFMFMDTAEVYLRISITSEDFLE